MQFSTIVISAIAVIASVHGAAIPAMDTPASSPVELEARSYNDQDSNSDLEKRSPGYGHSSGGFSSTMMVVQPQMGWSSWPVRQHGEWGVRRSAWSEY
ncbi:hypothetical protein BASA50_008446 [Batrachochytrium salamandrivorans]|uniref:Uncharacterized protein n=1 Tax=Batrachochytrium salamandrivorans TaxID=1357716 RepID=A0ABQ8F1I5_9FUNG|nr:hypothetical protein BASA60_010215 [Batrachochytrium salamandrivorans]KAH6566779.1 hypothetical protein BASA62_006486 [Batrachochytrium salamandrivorans]KAH6588820.1 hypothetical protein BASA50_010463 [Batrachochytrium salamandrivorans]KAH6591847.1 hypothetical protein BASA50_008446 [Batrachochytrium salamandrivorans]KAH6599456.1 hypothetical protein BASA61_002554 [Batrachochytrium salamandrivorans]